MRRLPALPRRRWLEGQVLGTAGPCSLPRHYQQDLVWGGSNKGVISPCPVVSLVWWGNFLFLWRVGGCPVLLWSTEGQKDTPVWAQPVLARLPHHVPPPRRLPGASLAPCPCHGANSSVWGHNPSPRVPGHGARGGRCGNSRPHPRAVADAMQGAGCPGTEQEAGAGGGGGARGARTGAAGEWPAWGRGTPRPRPHHAGTGAAPAGAGGGVGGCPWRLPRHPGLLPGELVSPARWRRAPGTATGLTPASPRVSPAASWVSAITMPWSPPHPGHGDSSPMLASLSPQTPMCCAGQNCRGPGMGWPWLVCGWSRHCAAPSPRPVCPAWRHECAWPCHRPPALPPSPASPRSLAPLGQRVAVMGRSGHQPLGPSHPSPTLLGCCFSLRTHTPHPAVWPWRSGHP